MNTLLLRSVNVYGAYNLRYFVLYWALTWRFGWTLHEFDPVCDDLRSVSSTWLAELVCIAILVLLTT